MCVCVCVCVSIDLTEHTQGRTRVGLTNQIRTKQAYRGRKAVCVCVCVCHSQDEVLSHRLGLVPLKIDPALLELKTPEEVSECIVWRFPVYCHVIKLQDCAEFSDLGTG